MSAQEEAFEYWKRGKTLDAGRILFEKLPKDMRPGWAAGVLKATVKQTGLSSPATEWILRIAQDRGQWAEGHAAFDAARREVLKLEEMRSRSRTQELMLSQMMVAELVAKVVYNATNPPDEFDDDSGWWIAPCLREMGEELGDADFTSSMWSVLNGVEA